MWLNRVSAAICCAITLVGQPAEAQFSPGEEIKFYDCAEDGTGVFDYSLALGGVDRFLLSYLDNTRIAVKINGDTLTDSSSLSAKTIVDNWNVNVSLDSATPEELGLATERDDRDVGPFGAPSKDAPVYASIHPLFAVLRLRLFGESSSCRQETRSFQIETSRSGKRVTSFSFEVSSSGLNLKNKISIERSEIVPILRTFWNSSYSARFSIDDEKVVLDETLHPKHYRALNHLLFRDNSIDAIEDDLTIDLAVLGEFCAIEDGTALLFSIQDKVRFGMTLDDENELIFLGEPIRTAGDDDTDDPFSDLLKRIPELKLRTRPPPKIPNIPNPLGPVPIPRDWELELVPNGFSSLENGVADELNSLAIGGREVKLQSLDLERSETDISSIPRLYQLRDDGGEENESQRKLSNQQILLNLGKRMACAN